MRIGPTEMILILVVVILIFGIGKLPELGKSLGEGLRSFKKAQDGVEEEVKAVTATLENKPAQAKAGTVTSTENEEKKDQTAAPPALDPPLYDED